MKTEPRLTVYNWKTDEYLLIDWYAKLIQSGDMALTFTLDMRWMGNFLQYFRKATLGYACDEKGIFFACWLEPLLSGAFFGMWIREDKRQASTSLKLAIEAYGEAFKVYTVLMGLCKQDHLKDVHLKLGYTLQCTIPGLWNGEDVAVYSMTREQWETRYERRKIQQQ
jgi:hypothetical protein